MYLGMIKEEQNKMLFLKIAAIISFADQLGDEEGVANDTRQSVIERSLGARSEHADQLASFLRRKQEELAALKLFGSEMGIEVSDYKVKSIDQDVLKAIYDASETVSEKLFAKPELREMFFVEGLSYLLTAHNEENPDQPLSVEERKVVLFEATGMAYADGDCSHLERALLNKIADSFGVDQEFIEEAGEIIISFNKLNRQGLELINE